MTRFTRAVGSKSSNKRVPEDATPWYQLKHTSSNSQPDRTIVWKKKECSLSAKDAGKEGNLVETMENEEYQGHKSLNTSSLSKNSEETGIVRFEGFPVRKRDAERLKELKNELMKSKIPLVQIKKTMKLERRRAEKALARERKKLCFHCRKSGHILSDCPDLERNYEQLAESGICYKCGSTEHQHTECKSIKGDVYKYAVCFICKEEGHISKQCPDNPRGLYPEGGSCRICGDVTHLKKDCPKFSKRKREDFDLTIGILNSEILDGLDEDLHSAEISYPTKKRKKVVRM